MDDGPAQSMKMFDKKNRKADAGEGCWRATEAETQ